MTIKIGSFKITLFKVEKLERLTIEFNEKAAKKQADELKNSSEFAELKARAQAARASRA